MQQVFKISLALFAILFSPIVSAQSNVEDSLEKVATKDVIDTSLIDANRQLSIMFQQSNPDEAIRYGLIALGKSKLLKDSFRIAQSYKTIGISYDYKGNLDSCLYHLEEAFIVFKLIKRKDYQSHTLTDKAMAYYYKGNYELALRNHLAALNLRKESGNNKFIAQSYNNIGLVYRSRKDYHNAIRFYKQSYEIKKTNDDQPGMLNSLINIGAAFQTNGMFDSAYFYGSQALALANKINSAEDIIASKENIAASLINLKRPDEALQYLKEADQNRVSGNIKGHLITNSESYGDMYLQKNDFPAAIAYYQKGLQLAKSNNRNEAMEVFYRKLAKCFYRQGNYQQAYDFSEMSKAISDTLINEENSRQVNEMNAVYETTEKEKQIEKLNAANAISISEAKRRSRERNYFILASILFLVLAVVAYKAFTSNKKKKEQLNAQNVIIEKSLAEKEVLLREIHHRVKNNLQIVSSLLSLQSNYIKDEQALDAIRDSRNRVHSMSLIHQNLYQEDNLTGIDVKDYIEKLTENLFQSYNIHQNKIKLIKEIEDLNLDVDVVIPLGLIINELVTNCLKYAFSAKSEGAIKVKLKEENGVLKLSVYDNGVGLPENFDPGRKKSFGHKMISAFLQKMKGEIKIHSEDGTKVDIEIKNYKKI